MAGIGCRRRLLSHCVLWHIDSSLPQGIGDMTLLKIAASTVLAHRLHTERALVLLDQTDFSDVAALVISVEDARSGMLAVLRHTGFAIPAFVGVDAACREDAVALPAVADVLWLDDTAPHAAAAQLEAAAESYQQALLPPFFDTLTRYVAMGNSTFACPGHQGGQFFRKHPAGRAFF